MFRRSRFVFIVFTLWTTILFTTHYVAQSIYADQHENVTPDASKQKPEIAQIEIHDDSVLHLIPDTTLGVIYCPSLFELNDKVNLLVSNLVPQGGPAPEYLAGILAGAFGAGFESLAELEEIGLDLNTDFAIFFTSLDPPALSATVHLTDPDAIKEVIESETEGSESTVYKGETYWSTSEDSASFAILDNTLIYSQLSEVIENVIDTKDGTQNSIVKNPDYTKYLTDIMEGTDQVSAFFNLETIIEPFSDTIKEQLQSTIDVIQSDPSSMTATPFIEGMFNTVVELMGELKSMSIAIQIDGTDVQLANYIKFTKDGKIHEALNKMSADELVLLNDLPNSAFLNGGVKGDPQLMFVWGTFWIKALASDISSVEDSNNGDDNVGQEDNINNLFEEMKGFYDSLAEEMSFSVNFKETFVPDYLVIYDLKNEEKMKTFMDEQFLEQMQKTVKLMHNTLGESPQLSMYDGAYLGNAIAHNDVEIKTIILPNFGAAFVDAPVEMAMFLPQEEEWSYAITENKLYLGFGGPQQIQVALDSKAKLTDSIVENISYQNLINKLGTENNLLIGISPLTVAKSFMNIAAEADPNAAAEMQMIAGILDGIPENFSIGISAKVHDGGVGSKLLLTLGDFAQLITTFAMLSGMGPMQ